MGVDFSMSMISTWPTSHLNSKINIPFHRQSILHSGHINPKKGNFQHQLMVNDNKVQPFWTFKFVQIQNFLRGVYDVGSIHKMDGYIKIS